MSAICQERGGAFKMPQPPGHRAVIGNRRFGLHADETGMVNLCGPSSLTLTLPVAPAPAKQLSALKPFGHRCPKDGGDLDELHTCNLCGTNYLPN